MRNVITLKDNFKFKKFELGKADTNALSPDYDDSNWRVVSVPHDWGIEGEFSADNDPSQRKVVQDGIATAIPHTGRTGGLPTVGEGIYRKWIELDNFECAFLELDGVMWESSVYINGRLVGGCHFGYLSYEVDITDYAVHGKNLIVIHATVYPESSRWYSGAGLYRNIRLVTKPKEHILYNGVWVRQLHANEKYALFDISASTNGVLGFTAEITDPKGNVTKLSSQDSSLSYFIENPILWDLNSPNLYTAKIILRSGDSVSVRFGARAAEFTRNGFFLNQRYLKMKGVCMHHDMGCIGAAINRSALIRQLEMLKNMGTNAIRTSHNQIGRAHV